jgi:type IV pilus assembly protein PilV
MSERGFSLIEALVALGVLSVGLLGASALLLDGLRRQDQALEQQAALWLVADVADLIRATPGAVDTAAFKAASRELFPHQAPEALVSRAPSSVPAAPVRHRVSLRWRDSRDGEDLVGVSLSLLTPPLTLAATTAPGPGPSPAPLSSPPTG